MYQIRQVDQKSAQIMATWAAKEGWNPGLHDIAAFFVQDPEGFFIGSLDNKPICTGCAVKYNDDFAFMGFYIVDSDYRNQGYGIQLTQARLDYLGERCIGLDGVVDMQNRYERNGFRAVHNNIRFEGVADSELRPHTAPAAAVTIAEASEQPTQALADYDERHFPARREAFIAHWVKQPNAVSKVALNNAGEINGVITARPCGHGYKIGPLFADNGDIARQLLVQTLQLIPGETYYLDAPETNTDAMRLVDEFQMHKVFETARMYRNGKPQLPLDAIYGITTFELG